MKIAGLDIGTTGCKCTVFDEQGNYLAKAYRDYPVKRTSGEHEIDITAMMDGVYACIREMADGISGYCRHWNYQFWRDLCVCG